MVLSVPISDTPKVFKCILPFLTKDKVVVDLSSVRLPTFELMGAAPCETLGLHAMFSPSVNSIKGQVVVLTEGNPGSFLPELDSLLVDNGGRVSKCDAETHDRMMAVIQGLTHFTNIATAGCLKQLGITIEETLPLTSPIYLLRMEMVGRILAQDPRLYAEIATVNLEVKRVIRTFLESANELFAFVDSGNTEGFIRYFEDAGDFFGNFRDKALVDSNFLIEKLAERENR